MSRDERERLRRRVVRGAALVAASGATVASAVTNYARFRAPFDPVLDREAFNGVILGHGARPIRVGFITDMHVGPVIRGIDIDRAMRLLAQVEPDLLLLGGDYVCESPRYIAEAAAVLGNYASSMRLGVLAVLGNHDYSNDASRLASALESRGIRVLRNEAVNVLGDESPLWVSGIDDAILGRPDTRAAFADVPKSEPVLALWHEPDWAEQSAARGAFLQLSGHSHGGQVRLPALGELAAPAGGRRFVGGLNAVNGMPVYTSRGVGVYRPPVRLCCPPEVTLISIS